MKKLIYIATFLLVSFTAFSQKKPIDHTVYDSWRSIANSSIPQNGNILIYYSTPQQGDDELIIKNLRTDASITVPRGTRAILNSDNNKVIATIKPLYEQTRDAKIKKLSKEKMPKDTLVIIDLNTSELTKYANLLSIKSSSEPSNYFAFELEANEKEVAKDSTAKEESSPEKEKLSGDKREKGEKGEKDDKKEEIKELLVLNTLDNSIDTLKNFDSYTFNKEGTILAYTTKPAKGDTLTATGLYLYNTQTKESVEVLQGPKESKFKLPIFSKGDLMAFYANTDTTKDGKKDINVYLYNIATKKLEIAASNESAGVPDKWIISENGALNFSENSKRLFLATSPRPLEKDTTLVEFEQPVLDIWSWDADYNQPMQLLNRAKDLKRSYMAYVNTTLDSPIVQLGDLDVHYITIPNKGMGDYAIISNDKKYRLQSQWDINEATDLYIVSVKDGSRELIKSNVGYSNLSTSPNGKYMAAYDTRGRNWVIFNVATGDMRDLTSNLDVAFYDEDNDTPSLPRAYSRVSWFEDGETLLIRDRFDYWSFSASGESEPTLLTGGYGRENNTVLQINNIIYHKEDAQLLRTTEPLYFSTFNETTKESGFVTLDIKRKNAKVTPLVEGPYTYSRLNLSLDSKKKAPIYLYHRGNFESGNNLWLTKDNFKTQQQISDINPQQNEYNWGTVELVNWQTEDDIRAEGLLFKPENFDPTKKYPIMIYFYEKNSETLYNSRTPAPSRSIINIPYFVSNEYIVFVPDIYYKDGHPGQSAMRSIMPAVEMLEQYPWIDGENMAIQGQSWGGYQVAYMITQTDKFKAAGAGAPVSNMTSAYGGIRWGSGMTRQFQYEQTQSRIGKDLWSGYDLYVENSPLFFLPNVTTPLLIMHNDKDGAVPWYQGIELFTGLRRLGKVAWLLQYNDEDHNLVERKNTKDLSIRLEQFFNHYLKGAPMPKWMKSGRPAVEKGFDLGYELIEE